ncbi:MAG: 3-keto-disaccharide hydrolase [Bryobacteraceae bacterium]
MRLAIPVLLLCATLGAQTWIPLFDGKTLDGWEVCNGYATYRVEDGAIVGTTAEGSPNSFLCTKREYGDFILEFETMTDPALNSGVQIRSHRYPDEGPILVFEKGQWVSRKVPKGRVYGYQVEIANEKSGTSGGIYDEARRGWLHNIASDPVASKAFKDNQWNHYRVEARGDTIRVWVNGVPCAHLTDPLDQSGFIALQVHAYKGERPAQVRWRNIRIQDLGRSQWRRIWDGRTWEGWKHNGAGLAEIVDGAFRLRSKDDDPRIAMVLSERSFRDLTLRLKFKILKGNSGVFVRTDPQNYAAYEVEVDAEARTGGFWETGPNGRKWVTGPEDNAVVHPGEWNELTASLYGHRIVFHINGVKTMELPDDTAGRLEGVIGLQAHGAKRPTEVWFKDIEILEPVR